MSIETLKIEAERMRRVINEASLTMRLARERWIQIMELINNAK